MNFREFVDKSFWALLLGIAGFAVHFLGNMSAQVTRLNEQIAVVVQHIAATDETVRSHERRIETLETLSPPPPRRR